ncbi:acyltransferase [Gelidibacter salicanalis]|uniref:Acyltransferase n=1 Tax=Gelidibacter salicanalis TaxID=291193 RepID=A0A5C7AP02_9FLAO|nr:acyltransferase [Gelidibacter salicanalis]TXE10516.1 acyltransferase [Gelidibacter salicanalis]
MRKIYQLKVVSAILFIKKLFYKMASTNTRVTGVYRAIQPVILKGQGRIAFGERVKFGVIDSPLFYNTYTYLEARTERSTITLGNNVSVNNQCSIVAEHSISIGNDVLIGLNCSIYDSNFHDLDNTKRHLTDPNPQSVCIGNAVFIGNNVTILKGVSIGDYSVIATGAIVTQSFPTNVVIGGNPAKIIRTLD